jgi:hypothetical protein
MLVGMLVVMLVGILVVMLVGILVEILVGMLVGLVKIIDPVELEIELRDDVPVDDVLVVVVDPDDVVVPDEIVAVDEVVVPDEVVAPDELAEKTVLDVDDTCDEGEADVPDKEDARTREEVLVAAPAEVDVD